MSEHDKTHVKKCEYCGKSYLTSRPDIAKFCSDKHRQRAWQEREDAPKRRPMNQVWAPSEIQRAMSREFKIEGEMHTCYPVFVEHGDHERLGDGRPIYRNSAGKRIAVSIPPGPCPFCACHLWDLDPSQNVLTCKKCGVSKESLCKTPDCECDDEKYFHFRQTEVGSVKCEGCGKEQRWGTW